MCVADVANWGNIELAGTNPTYRPLPHRCESHITSHPLSAHPLVRSGADLMSLFIVLLFLLLLYGVGNLCTKSPNLHRFTPDHDCSSD